MIYRENNSATSPCTCSASCQLVRPAPAGPHRRPATLTGLHTVDTFSMTEPATVIHCMSSVDRVQDADAASSPLISVLVATERGRRRCAACRATRRGEATRVGSPGRVPRRSNRSARAPTQRSHHPPEGLGHIPHASTPAGSFAGSGARTAGAPTDPQRTDPRVPNAQPRTADQQRWQGFGTDKVSDQRGEHGSVGSVQARPRVGSAEYRHLVA